MTFLWSVDVTFSERLTRHSLRWRYDVLGCVLISRHVAWSYGRGWVSLALQVNVTSLKNVRFKPLFHSFFAFPLTVHLLCNLCISCALPLYESSRLSHFQSQRYGFSTPILLTLYCIDLITVWDFYFSCISLCSSPFPLISSFSPFLWVSRVGRGFLGLLPPFLPNPIR